ncbi:MAG: hypothetical protein ACYCPW_10815 [Nitrososphaerales archaeon]
MPEKGVDCAVGIVEITRRRRPECNVGFWIRNSAKEEYHRKWLEDKWQGSLSM